VLFRSIPSKRETEVTYQSAELLTDAFFDCSYLDALDENTIVCAMPIELPQDNWDLYAACHNSNDLCIIINIISERNPELIPFLSEFLSSRRLYANNMFAMPWCIFDELCSFWFDLLKGFENQVMGERASNYQNRDISFLSERVFDLWLRYKKSKGLNVLELPIFFLTE